MRRTASTFLGGALAAALIWIPACTNTPQTESAEPESAVVDEPAPGEEPEATEPAAEEPTPEKNNLEPIAQAEPSEPAASPEHVWAPGKAGKLILGLDGGLYEPYYPATVRQAQLALSEKGLYAGDAHGVLDEETMKAVGEFQLDAGLKVSGVLTPKTRQALFAEPVPPGTT